ncbi:MAG: hypothetical protein OXI29_00095 [bacterium]|nr:hypothetical protein [bacterium]MDE2678122.1 hypothetical protein [Gemmatimonadota bacterium]
MRDPAEKESERKQEPTFEHVENLIRQESKALRQEMRESFEILRKNDIAHIDERLDGVGGSIEGINSRLDGVEGSIKGINGRLDGVDGRLDRLETGMAEVLRRLPDSTR